MEYPCDECGDDGPHMFLEIVDGKRIYECANTECGVEFGVPSEQRR